MKETKQYTDANKLATVRRDVLHKKNDYQEQKLIEVKKKSNQLYQKIKNNMKREKSTEKKTQSRLN